MAGLRENSLIGFGNPLLDISARVTTEFLAKYDMKENDAILADEKHKNINEELVNNFQVEYIAGGSVQNSLRVAQWLLEKPNICTFFGCVGRDKFAKILEDQARLNGVNVIYQTTDKQPTGTCAVLLTGHSRSLCANLAASTCFTEDHLAKTSNRQLIENAEYFYISGFFITSGNNTVKDIAKYSGTHNRLFIMNLSAPFVPKLYMDIIKEVYPNVDVIFGNETEAQTFAEEYSFENTSDLKSIALKMSNLEKSNNVRPRIVIITQGHLPVLVAQNNNIQEFPVDYLPEEQMVDTNGAGDAFVGGFLSQFIQKKSLATCVKCGVWAASQIIKRPGCTYEGVASFSA